MGLASPSDSRNCFASSGEAASNASHISSSEALPVASRLYPIVPANNTGSCGIIDKLSRRVSMETDRMSMPSISTLPPFSISTIRNSVKSNELFPEPVLPTTPKVLPGGTRMVTSFNTSGEEGLYRMDTFLNRTPPFHGQPSALRAPSLSGATFNFGLSVLGKETARASPTPFNSLGILDLWLPGEFNMSASSESKSVSSRTLMTLII
mmetsp:Transcript_57533/g.159202  ORF Transcript_57533/g.159202 Transcript_57533/m.159202 type:complete len:208 (-) Transcript_57533:47-670(-)